MYDWDKLIFTVAVAGIGAYAVYAKDSTTAGVCLGIMGAILRPGSQQKDDSTSTTTVIKKSLPPPATVTESSADDTAPKLGPE